MCSIHKISLSNTYFSDSPIAIIYLKQGATSLSKMRSYLTSIIHPSIHQGTTGQRSQFSSRVHILHVQNTGFLPGIFSKRGLRPGLEAMRQHRVIRPTYLKMCEENASRDESVCSCCPYTDLCAFSGIFDLRSVCA